MLFRSAIKHGYIFVASSEEMESRRETEDTRADDDDGPLFHREAVQIWMRLEHGQNRLRVPKANLRSVSVDFEQAVAALVGSSARGIRQRCGDSRSTKMVSDRPI